MSEIKLKPKESEVAERFKIVVFGDAGVGKTTLTQRYVTGLFKERYKTTIGVDLYVKKVEIDEKVVSLQIWDFAGEERFRFLMHSTLLGAKGAIFMYDITRLKTLENLNEWLTIFKEINEKENQEVLAILVGGKSDLKYFRTVSQEAVVKLAKSHGLLRITETSSKKGENVDEIFTLMASLILQVK